jgi:hypothetical protein
MNKKAAILTAAVLAAVFCTFSLYAQTDDDDFTYYGFPPRTYDFELSDIAERLIPVISFNIGKHEQGYVWQEGRSSALTEKRKPADFYEITKITDGDPATAWVEGKKGDGTGEWVIIKIDAYDGAYDFADHYRDTDFDAFTMELSIMNGYQKNKSLYFRNNRVKDAKLTVYAVPIAIGIDDAGIDWNPDVVLEKNVTFSDVYTGAPEGSVQKMDFTFTLPEKYRTQSTIEFYLKFEIGDVYRGTRYRDTCVSELSARFVKTDVKQR